MLEAASTSQELSPLPSLVTPEPAAQRRPSDRSGSKGTVAEAETPEEAPDDTTSDGYRDKAAVKVVTSDKAVMWPEEDRKQIVELLVPKSGPADRLGMDVKHVHGRLVVAEIIPGYAVDRAIRANLVRTPPGDVLKLGDVIVRVNDVVEGDIDMVNECRQSCSLWLRAERKLPP